MKLKLSLDGFEIFDANRKILLKDLL